MLPNTIRKIEIEVKGTEENQELALASLLDKVDYSTLKRAISSLATDRVVRLAQATHGQMYRTLENCF